MSKIKTAAGVLLIGVMSLAAGESTQAALIYRGNGLIYDNVLDVTWVQDVALSQTLLGGDGRFDWFGAKAWVDQLEYGGYDDWRLPTLTPVNGINFNLIFHCDGSADYGYGIAAPGGASAGFIGNELAYMYHVNLGNQSACTGEGPFLAGKTWGPDVGVQNASFVDPLTGDTVSFLNLEGLMRSFWTDYDSGVPSTFQFTYRGFNDVTNLHNRERAWAVRDGDVLAAVPPPTTNIPEPSTLLLLSGLLPGLWFSIKRKNARQRFAS